MNTTNLCGVFGTQYMASSIRHFPLHLDGISVHFLIFPVISGQTAQSVSLRLWTHLLFTLVLAPLSLCRGSETFWKQLRDALSIVRISCDNTQGCYENPSTNSLVNVT